MAAKNAGIHYYFGKCTNAGIYFGKCTIRYINACKIDYSLPDRLVPVVGGVPLVGDGAVVHVAGVDPLELPASGGEK